MKRWVVTGTSGLLGRAWLSWLESQEGTEVMSVGRTPPPGSRPPNATHVTMDLTRSSHAVPRLAALKPYAIIHLAGPDGDMTTTVVEAAVQARAKVVWLSCDRVFAGAVGPFDEGSVPTQRGAEEVVESRCDDRLILRASTLYGWCPARPQALLSRWWDRWQQGGVVVAPVDILGTPTWVDALPRAAHTLMRHDGLFHLAGPERMSLYELACRVAGALDLPAHRVRGMAAEEDPTAYGPAFAGGLVSDRVRLPSVEAALEDIRRQALRSIA